MTYLRREEERDAGLSSFGCGPSCACGPCRTRFSGLGELYIRDDDADEPEPVGDWELAASIAVDDPKTGARCQADERRITHPIDPPPADVVTIDPRFLTNPRGRKQQLHRAAYAAYVDLKRAAEADGLPAGMLTIVSAYRSAARQKGLWEAALKKYGSPEQARVWVAPPGGSPHHSGRAIDFWLGIDNSSANVPALRKTRSYHWLVCNAARFGFTPYAREPWHWEFNPARAAANSRAHQVSSPATGTQPTARPHPSTRPSAGPQPIGPRHAHRQRPRPAPQEPLPAGPLGTLLLDLPGKPRFAYRFTPDDEIWATRFIVGEAGGADNPDNRAVLSTMFNRFAFFTHRIYPSFAAFIRAYSTPLQPVLRSAGAARRHANSPDFVRAGGSYPPPNQDVLRGQLRRHLELQRASSHQLPATAVALVRRALTGQIPNLIGNATEFANTAVYFHDRNHRAPTEEEWRRFTTDFARSKKWTWIGPVHGLDQLRSNAFFVDDRVANFPANAVRIMR